jgi:signal transduction histidine kinase
MRTVAARSEVQPASTPDPDALQRRLVRIALDLHDGPLQDLAALGFMLGNLRQTLEALPADTSEAAAQLADVHLQLARVERVIRAVAAQGESKHDPQTLLELVDQEIGRFRTRSTAAVEVDIDGQVEPETASQRIAIHSVLREALENILRHSRATRVQVALAARGDTIQLRVSDNGTGFDPSVLVGPHHARQRLGVRGMRRRLDLIGGRLEVESRPGGPTSITATVRRWRPGPAPAA